MGEITPDTSIYFVRLPEGGTYGTGPQGKTGAGPIGFVSREMAAAFASLLKGEVITRSVEFATDRCAKAGWVLYVRDVRGQTFYSAKTAQQDCPQRESIRIDGQLREQLIDLTTKMGK